MNIFLRQEIDRMQKVSGRTQIVKAVCLKQVLLQRFCFTCCDHSLLAFLAIVAEVNFVFVKKLWL